MIPNSYIQQRLLGNAKASDFATNLCYNIQKIKAYDSALGREVEMAVPCGHCPNCIQSKRNDWVSRMVLHSMYWHFCYFVTLTYGSYNLNEYYEHPFKDDWLATFPVCDRNNYSGVPCWTPSILVNNHLQKFLKRLRAKRPDLEISYCACGELGDNFGRPHFHLILWSRDPRYKKASDAPIEDLRPLTEEDVRSAWSLDCFEVNKNRVVRYAGQKSYNKRFRFNIGRIDFENLTLNGTMQNTFGKSSPIDSKRAQYCFEYVAKYVTKDNPLNQHALVRFREAFERHPLDFQTLTDAGLETYWQMHSELNYDEKDADAALHRELFYNDPDISILVTKNKKQHEKIDFNKFCDLFGNFFVSSRRYVIGKEYAVENFERFSRGDFSLPAFRGKELAIPRYFFHYTSLRKFPLKFRVNNPSGFSFGKGSLQVARSFYSLLRSSLSTAYLPANSIVRTSEGVPLCFINGAHTRPDYPFRRANKYLDVALIDGNSYVYYSYSVAEDYFFGYQYDVHAKSYYQVDALSRYDFCDMIIEMIDRYLDEHKFADACRQMKLDFVEDLQSDPQSYENIQAHELERVRRQNYYKPQNPDLL